MTHGEDARRASGFLDAKPQNRFGAVILTVNVTAGLPETEGSEARQCVVHSVR